MNAAVTDYLNRLDGAQKVVGDISVRAGKILGSGKDGSETELDAILDAHDRAMEADASLSPLTHDENVQLTGLRSRLRACHADLRRMRKLVDGEGDALSAGMRGARMGDLVGDCLHLERIIRQCESEQVE